jgi:hypothetical protein
VVSVGSVHKALEMQARLTTKRAKSSAKPMHHSVPTWSPPARNLNISSAHFERASRGSHVSPARSMQCLPSGLGLRTLRPCMLARPAVRRVRVCRDHACSHARLSSVTVVERQGCRASQLSSVKVVERQGCRDHACSHARQQSSCSQSPSPRNTPACSHARRQSSPQHSCMLAIVHNPHPARPAAVPWQSPSPATRLSATRRPGRRRHSARNRTRKRCVGTLLCYSDTLAGGVGDRLEYVAKAFFFSSHKLHLST